MPSPHNRSDDEYELPDKTPKGKEKAPNPGNPSQVPSPIINPPANPTIIMLHTKDYSNVSRIADRDHLTDNNWHEWKECFRRVIKNCDITGYVDGTLKRPSAFDDPGGAANWDKNDIWAQQVLIQNVTSSHMNHVGSKLTAFLMFGALVDTHKNKVHQMVNHIQTLLYETKAGETNDIPKHLDTLKPYWDCLN
jgi:hypothetical protein